MEDKMSIFADWMAKKYHIQIPETAEMPVREIAETPEKQIPKTKPNKAENFFMMDIMILKNSLATRRSAVEARLKKVDKYAKKHLDRLYELVDKMQTDLLKTMPESRMEYYAALARNGRYHLDIEGPIRQGRMLLITDIHLAQLSEAVMENECIMCLRTGKEIERCPYRQALLEVAPPTEILEDKCEYTHAAGQLINGEDVTI